MTPKSIPTHFSQNVARPDKLNSGDSVLTLDIVINGTKYVLLLQADGVSSAPKDFEASNRSLYNIVEYIKENNTNSNIIELITESIYYAHNKLVMGELGTMGKQSTLCLMLIDELTDNIYYTHIGDSRIYGYIYVDGKSEWQPMTEDQSRSEIYKENGKPLLQNGKPIFRSILTQCLGTPNELDFTVKQFQNKTYTGFCLVSDGFYELDGAGDLMTEYYHAIDYFKLMDKKREYLLTVIKDDATIAIWRKPLLKSMGTHNESFLYTKTYSKAARYPHIIPYIFDLLDRPVIDKERESYLDMCVNQIYTYRIYYDKNELIQLLNKLYEYHSTINPVLITNLKKHISTI